MIKTIKAVTPLELVKEDLKKNDFGQTVVTILKYTKANNFYPSLDNKKKSEVESNRFRILGNEEFKNKNYDTALQYYNMALLMAPLNTRTLKMAYGNRSALLLKVKKLKQCLKDIDICLSSGYPSDLVPKLIKRQNECKLLMMEEIIDVNKCEEYLQVTRERNEKIPCASSSIEIKGHYVRASKLIQAGEVIADETAYVSLIRDKDRLLCCHHCLAFSCNLIPCNICCCALFCDEDCKKRSWEEYHKIECQIMSLLDSVSNDCRLSLKAVLKARSEVNSWDDLVKSVEEAEKTKGYIPGPYTSTRYQNLCTESSFDQLKKYGKLLNSAAQIAEMVHYLSEITSIVPQQNKEITIRFLGKQMMLHAMKTALITQNGSSIIKNKIDYSLHIDESKYLGYYPFTKMIRHSCNPNIVAVSINNKVILIAMGDIPKGTELLMTYRSHFLLHDKITRKRELFDYYGFICKCEACHNNWNTDTQDPDKLTYKQQLIIETTDVEKVFDAISSVNGAAFMYAFICRTVVTFQELPRHKYYKLFVDALTKCLALFQAVYTEQDMKGKADVLK